MSFNFFFCFWVNTLDCWNICWRRHVVNYSVKEFLNTLVFLEDVQAGLWVPSTVKMLGISVPFLLAGMFIGSKLVTRMSQLVFMKLTYILLFISGLSLLVK